MQNLLITDNNFSLSLSLFVRNSWKIYLNLSESKLILYPSLHLISQVLKIKITLNSESWQIYIKECCWIMKYENTAIKNITSILKNILVSIHDHLLISPLTIDLVESLQLFVRLLGPEIRFDKSCSMNWNLID